MLSVVKLLPKGEVGGCVLNSHGNYIVVENHGKIMELCFCIYVGILYCSNDFFMLNKSAGPLVC